MEHRYPQDVPNPHMTGQPIPSSHLSAPTEGLSRPEILSMEKKRETRRRTKTGCSTCRKRRIKCDEGKPECLRCLKSKRPCEGYSTKTVFKNENALHYQQSIRPSPLFPTSNPAYQPAQAVQFSTPSYRNGSESFENGHNFVVPQNANGHFMQSVRSHAEPNSRNSSASNASGVSANSEQRRISVLSLMSSDKDLNTNSSSTKHASEDENRHDLSLLRTPESDARDNFYYNYYISQHAYMLARRIPQEMTAATNSRDDPHVLWAQIVPSFINDDPPGCRPLFDAVVAYTAHVRFETISIDYGIRSSGEEARHFETALKAYIDIIRGTSNTIQTTGPLFALSSPLCVMLRWGLLQHVIVNILADANPRVAWINYLSQKALNPDSFVAKSPHGQFYLIALRHISTGQVHPPQDLLELYAKEDFSAVPGLDIVYFALIRDFDALKSIAYHILASPRLEYLFMIYQMLNGARLRGQPGVEHLLDDLSTAMRQA